MSWLFTQVWLWSLAAFALGSLLTWWLFVRPLKRELRELRELGPRAAAHPGEVWESAPPEEQAPLDLLRDPDERWAGSDERTDDGLDVVRESEEPTFGDWERPSRWGPYGSGGWADDSALRLEQQREPGDQGRDEEWAAHRTQPVVGHPGSSPTAPPEVDQGGEPASGAAESSAGDEAEPAGGATRNTWFRDDEVPESYEWSGTLEVPVDDNDAGSATERDPSASGTEASEGQVSPDTQQISEVRESTDSDRAETLDGTTAREQADPADQPGGSGRSGEKDADKSARLRSLFEPVVMPGDQHRDAATPDAATQHIPRIEDEPRTEDEPRSGDESGPEGSGQKDSGQTESGGDRSDQTRQDRYGEAERSDEQGSDQPHAPGAGPTSDARNGGGSIRAAASAADFGGGAGDMIKGHFASQQYHTPESPQYDRIAAEVWFRTAADAEQAGFEPWDGSHRAAGN